MDGNYIYGRNAVIEALKAEKEIEKIFVMFGTRGEAASHIFKLAKDAGIVCVTYDKSKFIHLEREISAYQSGKEKSTAGGPRNALNTQGVIALVRPFAIWNLGDFLASPAITGKKNPIVVLLDGITDPHNLGAIARAAECSGCSGIIIPERDSAPLTPAAVKSSAGALEHLPVVRVGNLTNALKKLKDAGFWVVGTDGSGDRNYTDDIYDSPTALIIGSEGKGMRPALMEACDFLVKIPMMGKITSLNASVSAGVVLFEILRQRMIKK